MSENKIQILSSGDIFIEHGVISIESKLLEMLDQTEHDLYIIMYTVSGKPENFWNKLEDLLKNNIPVSFIIDGSIQHAKSTINILNNLQQYNNFHFYSCSGDSPLHAKLIVSDGKRAIIGSANISGGGLVQNHEIAVYIEGKEAWILKKLAKQVIRYITDNTS